MSTVRTLIQLQFKAGVRLVARDKTLAKTVGKWLILGLIAAALLTGFIVAYSMLASQFTLINAGVDLTLEFLTFTVLGFMIIQTLFLIPMLIKILDVNNDRELLLKLPVSSRQIFISKIIVAYAFELLFALAILAPMLMAYGFATGASWYFFTMMPLFILFVPVFPFFLAIILLFPILKITLWVKSKTSVTTILYLVALVAAVVLYMLFIQTFVRNVASAGFAPMLGDNAGSIQNTARFMWPARAFALMTYGTVGQFFINFGIILGTSAVLLSGAIFIANAKYKKFYMQEHGTYSSFSMSGGYRGSNPTKSVVKRECLNIFRSPNYTFQFLLIVVITPLLIFFSNRIANYAMFQSLVLGGGAEATGLYQGISFEISTFITIVLVPLAASFAASNISREGGNIYHTKIIPVGYRKQLIIKTLIVFIPIFIAILVGSVLSTLGHNVQGTGDLDGATAVLSGLSGGEVVMLMAIATFMTIGYICLGTYFDLRRPLCNQIGTGELTKATGHANFIIVLGALVGIGFGAMGLFSAFSDSIGINFSTTAFRWLLLAFSVVFGAIFSVLLFIDGPKRYHKLEQ